MSTNNSAGERSGRTKAPSTAEFMLPFAFGPGLANASLSCISILLLWIGTEETCSKLSKLSTNSSLVRHTVNELNIGQAYHWVGVPLDVIQDSQGLRCRWACSRRVSSSVCRRFSLPALPPEKNMSSLVAWLGWFTSPCSSKWLAHGSEFWLSQKVTGAGALFVLSQPALWRLLLQLPRHTLLLHACAVAVADAAAALFAFTSSG